MLCFCDPALTFFAIAVSTACFFLERSGSVTDLLGWTDTDSFFGSLGNFFLFEGYLGGRLTAGANQRGSFEVNPPFVESVMNDMTKRIEYLLVKYKEYPFSFAVIVPAWTDCKGEHPTDCCLCFAQF